MIPIPEEEYRKLFEDYEPDQTVKADAGKPRISLVPLDVLIPVALVREYGLKKYGEKESWRSVSDDRYRDAMMRHVIAYMDNPDESVDAESGLPSLWHLLTNVIFLVQKDLERRSQC